MNNNITFVDIETPNHRNDCISSIGIINVDDQGEVISRYYLVDPEATFDLFNINLTGITPEMVVDQPNFKQLWPKIEKYFINSLVVAHNAIFDVSIIVSCLKRYQIPVPKIVYTCTYRIARSLKIPSKSFKLNDLSRYYNIELKNHHHAMDDTKACMEIFYSLLQAPNFVQLDDYIKQYEQPKIKQQPTKKSFDQLANLIIKVGFDNYLNKQELKYIKNWLSKYKDSLINQYSELIKEVKIVLEQEYIEHYQYLKILKLLDYLNNTKSPMIRSLYKLMTYLEDKKLNNETILNWIEENQKFNNTYPFKQIINKLEQISKPISITPIIELELLEMIKNFLNPTIDQCENIDIKDKKICLTGDFNFGDKKQLEKFIKLKQGIISKSVTKKVDYLVIGNKSSTGYKYGRFGAKVNRALMIQSEGQDIKMISENRLMEVLKEM